MRSKKRLVPTMSVIVFIQPTGAIGGALRRSVKIRSMAIDDPLAATASQYPEQQKNKVGELALELAGVALWQFKIFNILRSRILGDYGLERVKALFNALQGEFHRDKQRVEKAQRDIEALKQKINSPEFVDSLVLAADEAQRTQSERKIECLGAVLANALLSEDDEIVAGDDLVGYIRDLSSLTQGDVQALQFLGDVFKDPIGQRPEMDDPNDFTMLMGSYLRGITAMSVHHDDFYSRCSRLTGFGLATEVERSPTRMTLKDHCFRPTRRGLRLIKLLASKTG
jgi:hypothetical protein